MTGPRPDDRRAPACGAFTVMELLLSTTIRFAINRISAPRLAFSDFTALVQRLGVEAIEIRNDLPGVELVDGTPATAVAAAARARGGIDRPGIQTQPDRHWQSVHWHRSAAHFILQFKVKLTVLGLAVTVTQRQPQAVTVRP